MTRFKTFSSHPQKRPTTTEINHWNPLPVILKTGPHLLPTVYTRAGAVAKNQPNPMTIGDTVYITLDTFTGNAVLVPEPMCGAGYELVMDAVEGVHYKFPTIS